MANITAAEVAASNTRRGAADRRIAHTSRPERTQTPRNNPEAATVGETHPATAIGRMAGADTRAYGILAAAWPVIHCFVESLSGSGR